MLSPVLPDKRNFAVFKWTENDLLDEVYKEPLTVQVRPRVKKMAEVIRADIQGHACRWLRWWPC